MEFENIENVIKENEEKVDKFIEEKLSKDGLAERIFGTEKLTERNMVKKAHGKEYIRSRFDKYCRIVSQNYSKQELKEKYHN